MPLVVARSEPLKVWARMTTDQEIRLITISREFGAGGSELAEELGKRLQWPVLDGDIVQRVAARLRLDEGTVRHFDEHPPSLLARIATVLIVPQPDIHSFPMEGDLPSHDAIAHATREVIQPLGASPPLIVVGHGSQCIFGGRSDVLHVRLVAPVTARLTRVMRRMNVETAVAALLIQRADRERQAYVQRYFHRDWRNEQLYDVQINTGHLSIEDAATVVETIVRARVPASAGSGIADR
jgi:cytidylate kinase